MNRQVVSFLITGLGYGGAETQLVRLATSLKARGWDVNIISITPPKAFVGELEAHGISVTSLGMRHKVPNPGALIKAVRLLRGRKTQILVCFMYHANILGRIVGRLAGVPVIVSSIRTENFGGRLRDRLISWTNCLDDCVTTNSLLAAESLIQRGVVSRHHLRVIPNGINVERYGLSVKVRNRARTELNIPDKAFLWLAVGRLEPVKDYFSLLEAFRKVSSNYQNAYLRIAGQGYLKEELEAKVVAFGLENRVKFLGLSTDVPALLAAADGLVLSSAWEGLPNVIMEAMAGKKPVVATSVGGAPELIQDGLSGFLAPPKEPKALADVMLKLMRLSAEERSRMGANGYSHIVENYSIEHMVDMWEDLYRDLLTKKGFL